MFKPVSRFFGTAAVGLAVVSLLTFAVLPMVALTTAQVEAADEPEPAPPADQEYTGAKRCASCHFEQFMAWKKTRHSKAFDSLTAKYEADAACLKCHATGFGEASGFKDKAGSAALVGVTCESCHGPGSIHEEECKPFAQVKDLTPEQEKKLRDSIWMMKPGNTCLSCHVVQGHKKSETPKELQ